MNWRNIILSRDFIGALVVAVLSYFLFAPFVDNGFAKDLYSVGISVLAIVFSVYFAALAIIISSGDNEFVEFLESRGYYSIIIGAFQFSLVILFIALIYSIITYTLTAYWISKQITTQNAIWFSIFFFLFSYGLFATANSSLDAIKYAQYRVKYLAYKKKKENQDSDSAEKRRRNAQ